LRDLERPGWAPWTGCETEAIIYPRTLVIFVGHNSPVVITCPHPNDRCVTGVGRRSYTRTPPRPTPADACASKGCTMAARKNPRTTTKRRTRSQQAAEETTTTSQRPEKKATRKAAKPATKKPARRRGRPRVSNTATERVTLRVEKDHLEVIDTLVTLKQYSNRSDALRHAIKEFCENVLDDVDEMLAKQQKRQKLLQLAALRDELDELQEA
jgi:Arc/MetJ-type ribon-helix-helix transcriptional regulator